MWRRVLVVSLSCAALGSLAAGCASNARMRLHNPHARYETVAETGEEHEHRVKSSWDHDRRALVDDLDLLFMTDRPSRLTKWHSR